MCECHTENKPADKPQTKTKYRYEIGIASWHQRKAGHYVSGFLIAEHTPEEHEKFMRNYRRRNENIVARIHED